MLAIHNIIIIIIIIEKTTEGNYTLLCVIRRWL